MSKKFRWGIIISVVVLGLMACKKNYTATTVMGAGAEATGRSGIGDNGRTYALPAQSSYHNQVMMNPRDHMINPLIAPANQTYYFDFDSMTVQPSDLHAIRIQADYLAIHPTAKVRLEGNTDNRGSREYNIGLGWRRDQAIVRILEQEGVAPSQLDIVSYGKEHPAILGNNEYAWRLNRRVNLIYKVY